MFAVALVQRTTTPFVLVAFLGTLLACGGGATKEVVQASAQPEAVTKKPATDAGNPVVPDLAASYENERRILEYIPQAHGVVLHLSLAKTEASEFFGRHEDTILGGLEKHRQEVAKVCQFDPMLDIETITVGADLQTLGSADAVFALTTQLGATRIEECIGLLGGKVESGRYVIGGDSLGYYWPTEDVLVLSPGKTSEEIMLSLRAGRALDNATLMQYLSRTDPHATLWGAGIIPASLSSMLTGIGGTPTAFVVRGSLWAGIDFSMELTFNSEKEASALKTMLDTAFRSMGQPAPIGDLIAAIELEQLGPVLRFDAQLSPELAATVLKELQ